MKPLPPLLLVLVSLPILSTNAHASPGDWAAYEEGQAAQQKSDLAGAERAFDRGCKSGVSASCRSLASVLLQKRDFAKARAALDAEEALRGVGPGLLYTRAAIDARAGKPSDAFAWLDKAYAAGVNDFDGANEDADLAALRPDARWAALQQTYACAGARLGYQQVKVAMERFRAGRPGEGAALWAQAIAAMRSCPRHNDEDIATLLGNIGTVHRDQKELAKSNQAYAEAIALEQKLRRDDQVALYLNNLAMNDYFLGDKAKATTDLEALIVVDRRLGKLADLGQSLNNVGALYKEARQYDKAKAAFEESIAIAEQLHDVANALSTKGSLADTHKHLGQHDKAIALFLASLPAVRKQSPKPDLILHLGGLGQSYFLKGDLPNALAIQSEALALERQHGKPAMVAQRLIDRALVHEAAGNGDKAVADLDEALAITQKLGPSAAQAEVLTQLASYHFKYRRLDQAEALAQRALALALARQGHGSEALALGILGRTQRAAGRPDEALATLQKELALQEKAGNLAAQASGLGTLGSVHVDLKQYERARQRYEASIAISKQLGDEAQVAGRLNDLGVLAFEEGKPAVAIARFAEVLPIFRKQKDDKQLASVLSNLGVAHFQAGQYAKATAPLKEAIALIETLRATAPTAAKREYLESQLANYQALAIAYLIGKDTASGLAVLEQSRAKSLREQLGATTPPPTLAEIQRSLPATTAVLYYQNTQNVQLELAVTKLGATLVPRYYAPLLTAAAASIDRSASAPALLNRRGAAVESTVNPGAAATASRLGENVDYDRLIAQFRAQLADPSPEGEARTRALGRLLYDHLIAPLEPQLRGKTELLIVPDQGLAVLPFEALVDPQGRYLVERFTIQYTPSLGIKRLLEQRPWPDTRRPLLALGGARYDGARVPAEYATRGVAPWRDLPGTLAEVQAIAKLVPNAVVLTGDEVARPALLKHDLAQYKALHFATHGVVVPQQPELSALVLSARGDDGYLRMADIAKLRLQADRVTLSACDTGLGKVYAGEGVVGLTQAFFVAGANSVTVSLWQVADESTATLMTELYQSKEPSYAAALAAVKRRFIKGELGPKLRAPYHWAPFVSYGR